MHLKKFLFLFFIIICKTLIPSTALLFSGEKMEERSRNLSLMIENMLLGIAVGDALGMGIEMKDLRWIAEHIDFSNERFRAVGRTAASCFE